MNKIINDEQCTIIWHVDNLKMSHVDPDIVSRVLSVIHAEYGNIVKMIIMRGKIHKYLGMTIDYSSPDKYILSVVDYIVNMVYAVPEYMKGGSATPASHHLFDIAEDAKLSQTNSDPFHHFLAQLLYLSKRACPDIQLPVSLQCLMFIYPNTEDYRKLIMGMKYIQLTIGLKLILSIYKSGNIKCYGDEPFVVHKDMRGHNGGFMTTVTG